ncbi:MAG TPA: nitroreductase family deazaflavin-dependent oxidoreductase [Euzebyales bacterium]
MLYGEEHVRRYRETAGEIGHEWQPGVFTLLLTTTGRRTGDRYTTPLIYREDGPRYVVVASNGGADEHPDWYHNLQHEPEVEVQVADQIIAATARTASSEDRSRLWPAMTEVWPDYDDYTQRTDRDIPLVVLTPRS